MTFDPVLMIMQPRQIDEAINSLKENLDIPKVWFRGYTEPQVVAQMNKYVRETNFSHYIVMSDDGIVSKQAGDTILKYGEKTENNVFTGWMNMHLNDDGSYSNISTVYQGVLAIFDPGIGPEREDYPPPKPMQWVVNQEGFIQTAVANFAMSIAPREIFLNHPIKTWPNGRASDHYWSLQLQFAGIKIWTHSDAFIKHLRQGWTPLRKNWLVGNVEPEIRYENMKWGNREDYV